MVTVVAEDGSFDGTPPPTWSMVYRENLVKSDDARLHEDVSGDDTGLRLNDGAIALDQHRRRGWFRICLLLPSRIRTLEWLNECPHCHRGDKHDARWCCGGHYNRLIKTARLMVTRFF